MHKTRIVGSQKERSTVKNDTVLTGEYFLIHGEEVNFVTPERSSFAIYIDYSVISDMLRALPTSRRSLSGRPLRLIDILSLARLSFAFPETTTAKYGNFREWYVLHLQT